jgi:hypothetical protein
MVPKKSIYNKNFCHEEPKCIFEDYRKVKIINVLIIT